MKRLMLLAFAALAVAVSACGSSSSNSSSASSSSGPAPASGTSTSSGSGSSAAPVRVTMKSLAFNPSTIHAKVGQTVQWTNDDGPPHNVSYVSGPKFTSSSTLSTGAKFQLKLTQAGTIHYFCSIHPFMKATIAVSQ